MGKITRLVVSIFLASCAFGQLLPDQKQVDFQELAALYADQGTDWCFDIATRVAPGEPAAWDMTTVANAAFGRYAREASDYRADRVVARPPGMDPG